MWCKIVIFSMFLLSLCSSLQAKDNGSSANAAEAETETKWDVNAKLEEGEEFPDGDILNDLE